LPARLDEEGSGASLEPFNAPAMPLRLRLLDLAVLILVAVPAVLLAVIIAIAIKLESRGPVIYRQTRIGKGGRPFQILKFRKMRHGVGGALLTTAGDERLTSVGRVLMITKLDELPQLINVLRGQMRCVGPRPELPEYVARYWTEFASILRISPGITGPTQVRCIGEAHHLREVGLSAYEEEILPQKLQSDLDYVERRSVLVDLAVLVRTVCLPLRSLGFWRRDHHAGRLSIVLEPPPAVALEAPPAGPGEPGGGAAQSDRA
jgi:lipopolysaccharide/colanic/teichoic acid biosynthesis glycosyltransferase